MASVAGEVQGALVSTALGVAQIKAGKMRGLATTAPKRSALLPELPTFAEAGYPKADFSAWFTLFVPTGTPAQIVATLNAQAVKAVQSPEIKKKLDGNQGKIAEVNWSSSPFRNFVLPFR